MSNQVKVLLYGAYGYTGKLILDELLKLEIPAPMIAGRSDAKIQKLANDYQLDYDVFSSDELNSILKKHPSINIVINAAGPFIETAEIIAKACIQNAAHYIDVTGEIRVFKQLRLLNEMAVNSGIMLLPGCGFDVVPTDCLANKLKTMLPDANHLELSFASNVGVSRGTAITAVSGMETKSLIREKGKLKLVKWTEHQKEINFGPFKTTCIAIPWGDLETAWISTTIPNIKVYMPASKSMRRYLGITSKVLQVKLLNNLLVKYISRTLTGPEKELRAQSQTHVLGWVRNSAGLEKRAHLVTPEGYTLTAYCVAEATKRILDGKVKLGFQTPATAYGFKFIEEIKGVSYLSREEA